MAKHDTLPIIGPFSGTVELIDIAGHGANSGQLEFVLKDKDGNKMPFVVQMDAEARVFAAMTTVLTAAYFADPKPPVAVTYMLMTGTTAKAIEVKLAS